MNESEQPSKRVGNILGEPIAEADGVMLKDAFYVSRNYRELLTGTDFRFVVGRRGSGKSALYAKVGEELSKDSKVVLLRERPSEENVSALHEELRRLGTEYAEVRKITKLLWKVQIFSEALSAILSHYKAPRLEERQFLSEYQAKHSSLFDHKGLTRSLEALRLVTKLHPGTAPGLMPEKIAAVFSVNTLETRVRSALEALDRRVLYLYDGLDEGWVPNQLATGVLGGLAKIAAELSEQSHPIHCMLFIRDNMLRALAQFDGDYSRNIEGNTLRLTWDEESLLHMIANRLRKVSGHTGENNIRAWNRFVQRGLENMDGFRRCLNLTLYRPRDLINLFNGAWQVTCGANRDRLIDSDVEATAARISRTRLQDLYKEYERVLPGLPDFAEAFRGQAGRVFYEQAKQHLQRVVTKTHEGEVARDFALLQTGEDAFNALFSVGFLGIQGETGSAVRFCHDGSNTDVQSLPDHRLVVIHPCYWRALDIQFSEEDTPENVLVRIDDEDDAAKATSSKEDVQQLRLRKLGKIVEELPRIPEGAEGAHEFEAWVLNTVRYLFANDLDHIALKPNGAAVQRRDIVGSIRGTSSGFWRAVEQRYDVGQFVIEVKNYREVQHPEFRQAWSYMSGPYGRCLLMVTRSLEEGISDRERSLVKEGYDTQDKRLVILMPAIILNRAVSKMRSANESRDDYIKEQLTKRLNTFERSYISALSPHRKGRS